MSRRMLRYSLVLLPLVGLAFLGACGGDDEGEAALEIVRLEHENLVFLNGDRLPLTIHWTGTAEFPVTVSLSVRPGDCPQGVGCIDEQHQVTVEANPIVVPEALWCEGQGAAFTVPWDVTIEDSNGTRTEPAQMQYSCRS